MTRVPSEKELLGPDGERAIGERERTDLAKFGRAALPGAEAEVLTATRGRRPLRGLSRGDEAPATSDYREWHMRVPPKFQENRRGNVHNDQVARSSVLPAAPRTPRVLVKDAAGPGRLSVLENGVSARPKPRGPQDRPAPRSSGCVRRVAERWLSSSPRAVVLESLLSHRVSERLPQAKPCAVRQRSRSEWPRGCPREPPALGMHLRTACALGSLSLSAGAQTARREQSSVGAVTLTVRLCPPPRPCPQQPWAQDAAAGLRSPQWQQIEAISVPAAPGAA
ncbi:uncharacterized protein LOC115302597 [Suricata suricatta]|uniref:uncharacterized protein LOC115302597 n=1 Tax=Suricata suricatta TaxID=37032 RepID=UPI00115564BD|nr:uncharacterized protein LOC115302597 [Suricata suricatta]